MTKLKEEKEKKKIRLLLKQKVGYQIHYVASLKF